MEKFITFDNIRNFAYVNDGVCKKPIRGIVLFYGGLGDMDLFEEDTEEGKFYGEQGLLYVIPYKNPWCWMNDQAVSLTDEVLSLVQEQYGEGKELPLVLTGVSMGGQSCLVYAVKGQHKPVACAVNCPVCDMVATFYERPGAMRSIYTALLGYPGTLEDALKSVSPLHLSDEMPKINYHVFHCEKDSAVDIKTQSEVFVKVMQEKGYDITYDIVYGKEHCQLTKEMSQKFKAYVLEKF